jgi:outer membrane protein TolC
VKGLALALLLAAPAGAETPRFRLSMAEAESAARAHSPALKAAVEESLGGGDASDERFAALLPRLTLDGSYRYQTEVPRFSPVPGQPAQPFGDHRATSIGPTVTWTLWDQGSLYKTWRAQKARAASADEQRRLADRQATLSARLAYVQVQLAGQQMRELADSLALSEAEYKDIDNRFKAGAVSRIDTLSSHQESLQRRKQLLQAQADLGASLRELLQLVGLGESLDLARPLDASLSSAAPSGLAAATLLVDLDRLDAPQPALSAAEGWGLDAGHPRVAAYARQAEAARLTASSLNAGRGPVIKLQGRASYDYPNGPVLESVTQKSVGLTASLPLFEGRQTARAVSEQKHLAGAAESRRELASEELKRDWDTARDALGSLRAQQAVDERSVVETEELTRLVYLSYKGGRSTYLEVQSANLRALEAKVQAARTRAQVLIQLSALANLAVQG